MKTSVIKILGAGYGAAIVLAAALHAAVGGVVAPILTVWIGGAILTLALAVWRTSARSMRPAIADDSADSLNAFLAEGRSAAAQERPGARMDAARLSNRDG